jgi:hypothetical protein
MESCNNWAVVDCVKLYERINSKLQSSYRGTNNYLDILEIPPFFGTPSTET